MKFKKHPQQKTFNDIGGEKTFQELADIVMSAEGNVKGETILNNINYIKSEEGEDTVDVIFGEMKKVGYPLEFDKIIQQNWYKESYNVLINLVMKNTFKWNDDDIFNSGRGAARISFFLKTMLRYLVSPTVLVNNASKYWKKQLNFGKLNVIETDEENKKIIVGVEGYDKSSVSCIYQAGYFVELIGYSLKNKENLQIEETKCIYAGDSYHEYTVTW
jgi:hypothetical protein